MPICFRSHTNTTACQSPTSVGVTYQKPRYYFKSLFSRPLLSKILPNHSSALTKISPISLLPSIPPSVVWKHYRKPTARQKQLPGLDTSTLNQARQTSSSKDSHTWQSVWWDADFSWTMHTLPHTVVRDSTHMSHSGKGLLWLTKSFWPASSHTLTNQPATKPHLPLCISFVTSWKSSNLSFLWNHPAGWSFIMNYMCHTHPYHID